VRKMQKTFRSRALPSQGEYLNTYCNMTTKKEANRQAKKLIGKVTDPNSESDGGYDDENAFSENLSILPLKEFLTFLQVGQQKDIKSNQMWTSRSWQDIQREGSVLIR
jgi:hypothetical protein